MCIFSIRIIIKWLSELSTLYKKITVELLPEQRVSHKKHFAKEKGRWGVETKDNEPNLCY